MSSMSSALGELAADASVERTTFLASAGDQLRRFIDANRDRIKEIGGLVLIDDDPDYLSVAPDGSFRSRTRYQDEVTGEWHSETEIVESAAELVELYNPAEVLAAFAEAAREQAGLPPEPTATDDLMEAAGIAPDETVGVGVGEDEYADAGYAAAADDWASSQAADAPTDAEGAARRLYDLALTFQERSQHSEARLIEQFEGAAQDLGPVVGDLMILDDEDERLWLKRNGRFEAEVVPERDPDDTSEREGAWRRLETPDTLVEFYDPTDVFGDLAEAIADSFPAVAGDDDVDEDEELDAQADEEADDAVEDQEDVEDVEDEADKKA
ncbi:MAG: hypothetical protein WD830_02190 [Chloroflexota bacterium]